MTQHIDNFLQDCITVTDDGSLVSLDELEGLYVYWCSLRGQDALATDALLEILSAARMEPSHQDGVDYVEGLVLTGHVVADFILAHDFSGNWGTPAAWEFVEAPVAVGVS
jgi:hypothetical protein